jgi:hypothetical protein
MRPAPEDRILDLGSEDGSHIAALVPFRDRVWIADIDATALEEGKRRFGFSTLLLPEDGTIPVPNKHFDLVFCSSVLEHATVDKDSLETLRSHAQFKRQAIRRQRRLAAEIARVGRRYFVQTPYRYFPIESHTWLPAPLMLLPRSLLLRLVPWLNRHWIKSTQLDFNLLTRRDMMELFPGAEIVPERFLGMTKSLVAIRGVPERAR